MQQSRAPRPCPAASRPRLALPGGQAAQHMGDALAAVRAQPPCMASCRSTRRKLAHGGQAVQLTRGVLAAASPAVLPSCLQIYLRSALTRSMTPSAAAPQPSVGAAPLLQRHEPAVRGQRLVLAVQSDPHCRRTPGKASPARHAGHSNVSGATAGKEQTRSRRLLSCRQCSSAGA